MRLLIDSFWRAAAYCLHKRVILWSLVPLLFMALLSAVLGYFFWGPAVQWVQGLLEGANWLQAVWGWLQARGLGFGSAAIAPVLVVLVGMPIIVVLSLLLVALCMAPALVGLVGERRFPGLERKRGGSVLASLAWSLGSTLVALIALVVSIPLWFVPPLVLIIPPLIWGWLTYRVMAFDALSEHASKRERQVIFLRHRYSLMAMGLVCGYLGAAPAIVWASGLLFLAAFWVLIPLAIWIYALVFAFSSLWFAHFCLAALEALRAGPQPADAAEVVPPLAPQPDAAGAPSLSSPHK
ncbi:EI24 domain-containing protein [Comamonas endophytica]|uniref:EI24 domain-containing protein n=1 Tax=Comamonas endophytica TaxID=2949090 RepID=A0ABY6GBH9_9BURK|nr:MULTISPECIES: EI24 domain-containing protein [unclassified Acidovorax]MCD2513716.1 EI24 domain-containing protein [Acidovorax sp. D4N7]UYG52278.1 EI24 domain-containing protein [Acidovorax sp. 5MLIR]